MLAILRSLRSYVISAPIRTSLIDLLTLSTTRTVITSTALVFGVLTKSESLLCDPCTAQEKRSTS